MKRINNDSPRCFLETIVGTPICLQLFWISVVVLVIAPQVGHAFTLRQLVDGYKQNDPVILLSECLVENGKAMLVVSPSKDIWFYEFEDDGQYTNSGKIEFNEAGFELKQGLGGIFSRERMRRIVVALMATSFELLTRDQFDKLMVSKPKTKCPDIKPSDVYK